MNLELCHECVDKTLIGKLITIKYTGTDECALCGGLSSPNPISIETTKFGKDKHEVNKHIFQPYKIDMTDERKTNLHKLLREKLQIVNRLNQMGSANYVDVPLSIHYIEHLLSLL